MDIRGIEITNQLRSAIRAKLLELGVRYDEELPDYILVMVVNKKSRQQMNEDLHLFLEDSTEQFVNWLHDQVLKKLQKVTIAKKKSNKESSTVIVKQEDELKKFKEEDQPHHLLDKTSSDLVSKRTRDKEFEELVGDLAKLNEQDNKSSLKIGDDKLQKKRSSVLPIVYESNTNTEKKDISASNSTIFKSSNAEKKAISPKVQQIETAFEKSKDSLLYSTKRTSVVEDTLDENSIQNSKRSKISNDSGSDSDNRIKSCINKPKITSVVSVKSRLGAISPVKKLDLQTKNSSERNRLESKRNETQKSNFIQNKNVDRRKQRNEELIKTEQRRDDKPHSSNNSKNDKSNKISDLRDKARLSSRSGTIKSRLGISNSNQDKSPLKSTNSTKVSKPRISNVRSRLGVRIKQQSKGLSSGLSRLSQIAKPDDNFEDEDDDAESVINTSLKSHIIAVKKSKLLRPKHKNVQELKVDQNNFNVDDQKEEDDKILEAEDSSKVPSKVIVTPRPLKPLQPSQKRATQSLLLRAVAEANQSVVMQKKIDPCLKEQKAANKIKITRDPWQGKILSINLNTNSKKRYVMEKIQVELGNKEKMRVNKSHSSEVVTEEHLDVVKSLFKRSDDKQKFLVTLNGYNNNILKERNSDDEERLEMEVNEDDELALDNNQYETYSENIYSENNQMIDDLDMNEEDGEADIEYIEHKVENSENNSENARFQDCSSKKRRKLSPIVYTRSRSSSPVNKPTVASTVNTVLRIDKRPVISSIITTVLDKSSEKCRYWPNCTLGIKCAYYHPEVMCSSFPACKFGEKCAYKHPKCKFGSACTKLGCIFSHPPVQCKYHPYCMKPGCPFSHPKTSSSSSLLAPLTPDMSSVRAKFTWKKKE